MTAKLIDGKAIAEALKPEMIQDVEHCKKHSRAPHLAVVQIGDNPASEIYVRNKTRFCRSVGINVTDVHINEDANYREVRDVFTCLNYDGGYDGLMLQLPTPKIFQDICDDEDFIQSAKDVDGQSNDQLGALMSSERQVGELAACTAQAVMECIYSVHESIAGLHMVIVGRSKLVGKPLAMLALRAGEDATVTVCHSKTKNLCEITRQADILVVAIGKPHFIDAKYVKFGATVIDVGINRVDGKVVGDVAPNVEEVAGALTPVPGGVGPLTVAFLARNTIDACMDHIRIDEKGDEE